ncbi:nickel-dependent hydrogenase large subunit [Serpentinicella alkaliphila]|uniref:Hydrogenase large subunit n=1 Tax=Serpentinicella alkaliphila TaxID=1734049 RepID=A0A4R2T3W2_9FIRM|nr:nickel-dependent hydrogenase large subunit [Serpentinicella alkaliphila]QUH26397.1 nickel-dependent hydrogenase large subunit [Serpentinicella alkaliphila]TCP96171.1 hydrogenase large subunit [Serpentinicella alkaliphila]
MGSKITINPITRISGFLEIQVEVEKNQIIDAKSSGMLFRGFEKMLRGRPPLDAIYFTERICGICSTAHSMGSTLALEDILDIRPDENDKMIRDFMHGCEFVQNHLRHFYQYTFPDFVRGPDIQPLFNVTHNDYRLPEELNRELSRNYLESIEYSRLAHEMLAVLGGKAPHTHGIFVGGVTVNLEAAKWIKIKSILSSIREFVVARMIPDVYTIAKYYSDYFENGVGYKNLMTYGVFDTYLEEDLFYVAPHVLINGELQGFNAEKITENIYAAWYEASQIEQRPTEPTVEENVYKEKAYSWIKAPRYGGEPMEVGPLARMWLSGDYTNGISTMDRTIARVLEVRKIIGIMEGLLERMEPKPTKQGRYVFSGESRGKGLIDTTRGSLGHWVATRDEGIVNYEIITPSSWNLSPEDSEGVKGVVEKALIGTAISDLKNPVEIGRIVRSFDPCVSCATHVLSDRYFLIQIRIV